LYNIETGQVFARKLLRLGHPEPVTARNELRVIQKLCDGSHKNIVKVLDFGDLPDASHIFIDMELCSVSLDQYNKSIRTTLLIHNAIADLKLGEIWSIVAQIADGLVFIHAHGEIHRDLKPQNGQSPLQLHLTVNSSLLA
jgi:serine/threonine protein kinase